MLQSRSEGKQSRTRAANAKYDTNHGRLFGALSNKPGQRGGTQKTAKAQCFFQTRCPVYFRHPNRGWIEVLCHFCGKLTDDNLLWITSCREMPTGASITDMFELRSSPLVKRGPEIELPHSNKRNPSNTFRNLTTASFAANATASDSTSCMTDSSRRYTSYPAIGIFTATPAHPSSTRSNTKEAQLPSICSVPTRPIFPHHLATIIPVNVSRQQIDHLQMMCNTMIQMGTNVNDPGLRKAINILRAIHEADNFAKRMIIWQQSQQHALQQGGNLPASSTSRFPTPNPSNTPTRNTAKPLDQLSGYPTVVFSFGGKWVDLRCPVCKGNSHDGEYIDGLPAFQSHLHLAHGITYLDTKEVFSVCAHALLDAHCNPLSPPKVQLLVDFDVRDNGKTKSQEQLSAAMTLFRSYCPCTLSGHSCGNASMRCAKIQLCVVSGSLCPRNMQ